MRHLPPQPGCARRSAGGKGPGYMPASAGGTGLFPGLCSPGELCSSGQVTPAGELCRHRKDACDLEEHCDGQQPGCPEDAFQENGTPCPGGYCYNGACPTLAQRCQDLWGPGEAGAPRPTGGRGS